MIDERDGAFAFIIYIKQICNRYVKAWAHFVYSQTKHANRSLCIREDSADLPRAAGGRTIHDLETDLDGGICGEHCTKSEHREAG